MRQYAITLALIICWFAVILAAPSHNGYHYKGQSQNTQTVIPQNKLQGKKQDSGIEIIKLDCDQTGPNVKESNGQVITVTYYDCGEKGQKVKKGPSNLAYLPKKNVQF